MDKISLDPKHILQEGQDRQYEDVYTDYVRGLYEIESDKLADINQFTINMMKEGNEIPLRDQFIYMFGDLDTAVGKFYCASMEIVNNQEHFNKNVE